MMSRCLVVCGAEFERDVPGSSDEEEQRAHRRQAVRESASRSSCVGVCMWVSAGVLDVRCRDALSLS